MLIGDSCVGKTCLLIRFKDNAFLHNNFIATVGMDYRVSEAQFFAERNQSIACPQIKRIDIDGLKVKLQARFCTHPGGKTAPAVSYSDLGHGRPGEVPVHHACLLQGRRRDHAPVRRHQPLHVRALEGALGAASPPPLIGTLRPGLDRRRQGPRQGAHADVRGGQQGRPGLPAAGEVGGGARNGRSGFRQHPTCLCCLFCELSQQFGLQYLETSGKTGHNVDYTFRHVAL